jgi:transcriptional regulator of acetoin/glycerol metabolism
MISVAGNRQLEAVREEYFTTGRLDSKHSVRPVILDSWRRSRLYGLDSHGIRPLRVTKEVSDGQLARAARPFVDEYRAVLDDMPCALTISDAEGFILDRWVTNSALERRLNSFRLVPGYSLAENVIGTCSSGISLETGRSVLVLGAEHLPAIAAPMASASAVVRHPITRRIAGTVALTCQIEDASPLILHWVQDQATKLEQQILTAVSSTERQLFATFLVAARDTRHPVICLNDRTIVSNAAAARITSEIDQSMLWELAAATVQSEVSESFDLVLPGSGQELQVMCEPIHDGQRVIGATLKLSTPSSPARPSRPLAAADPSVTALLPRLAGRSAAWLTMCRQLAEARQLGSDILLIGGPGTGKSSVLADLALDHAPLTRVESSHPGESQAAWCTRLQTALAQDGGLVIVDDADARGPVGVSDLSAALAHDAGSPAADAAPTGVRPTVLASMSWDGTDEASEGRLRAIEQWPGVVIKVPSLRERTGDIPVLLNAITRVATASRSRPAWAPESVQVLSRVPWSSNVTSLAKLVTSMLRRSTGPVIRPSDLPVDVVAMASRRQLVGLEHLEAHAIAAAMKATGGNKKLAADRLGIARSTLYRKVRALGIDLSASTY